jgi:L-serine deaminase
MTSSLANFISSLVAGALVVAAIATALATDADAATGGSTTWTITNGLSGTSFA